MARGSLLSVMAAMVAVLALNVTTPAGAVPGGKIGTLLTGRYMCETPGDISGIARLHVPEADFDIITASSYVSKTGRGSYLLTGDRVVMTSGPFKGRKFERVYTGFLRMEGTQEDGTELRCVLETRH